MSITYMVWQPHFCPHRPFFTPHLWDSALDEE